MDYITEKRILDLIENKKYLQLKKDLSDMLEVDIAAILDPLDPQTSLLVFRMLPKDMAVEVFANFSSEQQSGIINSITDIELEEIIDELFFDDMIDLLEEIPANLVNKILKNSTKEERALINEFLKYPQDSAGSIMTIDYVELKGQMTVKEAIDHIREIGLTKETIYTNYVTDANRKLIGIVSLRKLVVSEEDSLVSDLMLEDFVYANTHDDQETVAGQFTRYGFLALPVVDKENRLTGIITVDDIMDVVEQEATEDFQLMAAMSPSEKAYLDTNVLTLARQRIPWLLVLMVTATFTGRIMVRYEVVLETVIVLGMFIPMLMDTGGNSGNQSSTLIIRGLATGEIETRDWHKVLFKEFRVSIIVAIALALINFIRLITLEQISPSISLVVSLTIVATIVISKIVGGILPIIAKKIKLDPAIMAGPLITTVVDTLALLIYFVIATNLLGL